MAACTKIHYKWKSHLRVNNAFKQEWINHERGRERQRERKIIWRMKNIEKKNNKQNMNKREQWGSRWLPVVEVQF